MSDLSGNRVPESPIVDISEDFVWEEASTDKYDYESDSDLDAEEDVIDRSQTSVVYERKYRHI